MKKIIIATSVIMLSVTSCTLKSNSSNQAQPQFGYNEAAYAPPPPVLAAPPEPVYATPQVNSQPPRYVPMDTGANPPILQATPASQAAMGSSHAPAASSSSSQDYSIPGVPERVYLPQYRPDLRQVAPPAQNGWVMTEDPYLADYRAKRGY